MKKTLAYIALSVLWGLVLFGVFLLLRPDHLEAFANFMLCSTGLVLPLLISLVDKLLAKKSRGGF